MDAIQILRGMHADAKMRFKIILATADPQRALQQWQDLLPVLDLHEQLEDQFVYGPLAEEMGPGTPLGDWSIRHDTDVAVVKTLIAAVNDLDPKQPAWRAGIGAVMDALSRHVMDEEGQIFGRVAEAWGPERLVAIGKDLESNKKLAAPSRRSK